MIVNPISKKWQYALLFPLLLLISSFTSNHAFYIGVVQITMEEKMTVQVKVFSDDLQAILQNEIGYQKVGAVKELCKAQTDNIQRYFQRTLQININEQPVELVLSNCEQINDVHLLHFHTIDCPVSWRQVAVNANFFMELFPTQSNVLQLNYKDQDTARRFGKMTSQTPTLVFKFGK